MALVSGRGLRTARGVLGADYLAVDIAYPSALISIDNSSQKRPGTINGSAFLRIDGDMLRS
jgi:hypothetical protein